MLLAYAGADACEQPQEVQTSQLYYSRDKCERFQLSNAHLLAQLDGLPHLGFQLQQNQAEDLAFQLFR